MIILHTADWHLNSMLGRQKRNTDLCSSLQQIAQYLEQEQVEVMVIAGDVFRERSRPEQIQAGIEIMKLYFRTFLARGGTIVAISGNHDSEILFTTLRDVQDLVVLGTQDLDGIQATGRWYFAPMASTLRLRDRKGNVVSFVLMPYPTPRCLRGTQVSYTTLEERNKAVQVVFQQQLRDQLERLDAHEPAVLVSHIAVRGSTSSSQYRLDDAQEVILELSEVPSLLAYVALGHIHRPQEVLLGVPHIRYAGSIERMDYGECADPKSVVVFEVRREGLSAVPRLLPLKTTTFYHVEIVDLEAQLPSLLLDYPEHQSALVRYTLHWDSHTQSRDLLAAQIEALFPRWYEREFYDKQEERWERSSSLQQLAGDVIGTTRGYLQSQLQEHPLRQEILDLAEQLFVEEDEL